MTFLEKNILFLEKKENNYKKIKNKKEIMSEFKIKLLNSLTLSNRYTPKSDLEARVCKAAGMENWGVCFVVGKGTLNWVIKQRWPMAGIKKEGRWMI